MKLSLEAIDGELCDISLRDIPRPSHAREYLPNCLLDKLRNVETTLTVYVYLEGILGFYISRAVETVFPSTCTASVCSRSVTPSSVLRVETITSRSARSRTSTPLSAPLLDTVLSQTHSDRVVDDTGLQNCQTVLQDISVTESIKEEADIFSDKMSCQHEKGKSEMHTHLKTRSGSDSPTFLPAPSPIVSSHRGLQHPTSILQRGTSSFSRFPQKTHLYRPTPKWDTFDRSGYRYPVGSAQLQRNRGQPPSDHFGPLPLLSLKVVIRDHPYWTIVRRLRLRLHHQVPLHPGLLLLMTMLPLPSGPISTLIPTAKSKWIPRLA